MVVALVFLAAALPKIINPFDFSLQIRAYHILNEPLSRWMAVVLPWLEAAVALLLLAGVWVNAASLMAAGMMAIFTAAMASAMARGLKIECGCFGDYSDPVGWTSLLRDLFLLGLCVFVFWRTMPHMPHPVPAPPPTSSHPESPRTSPPES
ncbi:MAG: DoxX family membrane protein [Candidatus Sumerlaeia bacterium]